LYATSTGTQHLRSETPYPKELKTLPTLFSEAGYFTSLYGKTDYNFDPKGLWEYWSTDKAPWRKIQDGRPFLSVFTLKSTHEGKGNSKEKYEEEMQLFPHSARHESRSVPVPPYHPNNEEFKDLWTRYYDLITAFDYEVGEILQNLEDDGLLDNTIVFIFSDHGFGMPRYKRWLYETGIKVPLIIHIPDKYRSLRPMEAGEKTKDLVSFVDFVPTALSLADIQVPDYMEGFPFLGKQRKSQPRKDIYAFRSRADNVYEMSRAVRDDRFIYIRHFMPHLPYIQSSVIFSDEKESYRNLLELNQAGKLPHESLKMFSSKPIEELYDLKSDPYELNNLAGKDEYQGQLEWMRKRLQDYVMETKDLGFLYESEMVRRADGKSPYFLRNEFEKFDLKRLYSAANMVGKAAPNEINALLEDSDSGVIFWGLMAIRQLPLTDQKNFIPQLNLLLKSASVTVQIVAAEHLYLLTQNDSYLNLMVENLNHPIDEVKLQAARALELSNPNNPEILAEISKVLVRYKSPSGASHPYTDYNFASFISWSLESILEN
uniref:sulfatase-like hydrolase/transferase n=1 Tax=Aquiflexum sp. TaxID=1872584 RepID=UPI0035934B43